MDDVWRGRGLEVAGRSSVAPMPHDEGDRARALRHGDLVRLRRGASVGADHWAALDGDERYRTRVVAVAHAQHDALVSHWSAAAMWHMPVVGRPDERVHLIRQPAPSGRSRRDVARHTLQGDVPETLVDGLRVTTAARTVVDVARAGGFVAGVVAADAALRAGLVSRPELQAQARAAGRGRGSRAARSVAVFADARSESPGESLSRARMQEMGLPAPELQHELVHRGRFVARLDFWWPERGVVGEFDGRTKYGLARDEADPAAALWREKLREDDIRSLGLRVARWTWQDAWLGHPMATRLRAAGLG